MTLRSILEKIVRTLVTSGYPPGVTITAIDEIANLETALEDTKRAQKKVCGTLAEAKDRIAQLEIDLSTTRENLESLEDTSTQRRSNRNAQVKALTLEIAELKKKVVTTSRELVTTLERNAELLEEISSATTLSAELKGALVRWTN